MIWTRTWCRKTSIAHLSETSVHDLIDNRDRTVTDFGNTKMIYTQGERKALESDFRDIGKQSPTPDRDVAIDPSTYCSFSFFWTLMLLLLKLGLRVCSSTRLCMESSRGELNRFTIPYNSGAATKRHTKEVEILFVASNNCWRAGMSLQGKHKMKQDIF